MYDEDEFSISSVYLEGIKQKRRVVLQSLLFL